MLLWYVMFYVGMVKGCENCQMMCRKRLCLQGKDQHVDMDHPPSLVEIWTRRHDDESRVLQSNVDAVVAQVSSVASLCVE